MGAPATAGVEVAAAGPGMSCFIHRTHSNGGRQAHDAHQLTESGVLKVETLNESAILGCGERQ